MFWETGGKLIKGVKDPNAVLDYSIDFSAWLLDILDTYASHSIVNVTGGIVVNSTTVLQGIITIWLSGGTVGSTATFTVRIATVGGRTDDRTFHLKILER